jgi:flagellar motor switch protein FliM
MANANVHSPRQEIVSQPESASPPLPATPAFGDEGAEGSVQPYQFRNLSSLLPDELRMLTTRHEEFVRSVAARLSIHLRVELNLQLSGLGMMRYRDFIEGLPAPTYLALLKLDPLPGVCLLNIPLKLGLSIVDRELGGPAQYTDEPRALSEIEARLLARTVEIIAGEWCSSWSDVLEIRPTLVGHESNGNYVQTCPRDTLMLVLTLAVGLGETAESIQFVFPYASLEPLLLKLNATARPEKSAARPTSGLKWNPALNDVSIKVSAELPEMEMTARQLADLQPGSTLFITPEMARQVRVCLAKKPKFIANLGTTNERWAAKIVQPYKP